MRSTSVSPKVSLGSRRILTALGSSGSQGSKDFEKLSGLGGYQQESLTDPGWSSTLGSGSTSPVNEVLRGLLGQRRLER